jgi:hypothetical protein
MDKLKASQQLFLKQILSGEFDQSFIETLKPSKNLSSQKALEVYRNDYTARLSSSIGEVFEGVWTILGDESFFSLCSEYLNNYNSESFDLGKFGLFLPELLKDHSLLEEFPFLYDLAILEKEFNRLFHSPQEPSISNEALAQADNLEGRKITLTNNIFLMDSYYPILTIWEFRKATAEEKENTEIDFDKEDRFVLYKNTNGIQYRPLSSPQINILTLIKSGSSIEETLEKLEQDKLEIAAEDISEIFQFIASEGLISAI